MIFSAEVQYQIAKGMINTLYASIIALIIMFATVALGTVRPEWVKLARMRLIDAVEEMVRVCAEKGTPLLMIPGSIAGTGIESFAIGVLNLIKQQCKIAGELGVRVRCTTIQPVGALAAQDYARQGFTDSGHPERFDPNDYMWYPGVGGWAMGSIADIDELNCGALFGIGGYSYGTQLSICARAAEKKMYQITGASHPNDYCAAAMLAEHAATHGELYAAGAYLTGDVFRQAITVGEDISHFAFIGVIVFVAIMALLGVVIK